MEQFEQLVTLMEKNQIAALKKRLGGMNATDVAAFLENLAPEKRLLVFRVLPKDLAADAFTYLPAEMQQTIVETISDGEVSRLADELCLDDTVDFLEEVPANVVKKVLHNVDKETRERITEFLKYPKNSAGSLMTVEFVELHDRLTVGQALDTVRREGDQMETVDTLYTIDNTHHLTGTLTLLDLVRADSSRKISELKHAPAAVARTLEDQEEVAADFSKYDLSHMPVVDGEGRLVGLITVDDIVDVIQDENTEDMEKMAAMAPSEKPYLKTSPWDLAKHRILWLLALMLSATITGRPVTGSVRVLPVSTRALKAASSRSRLTLKLGMHSTSFIILFFLPVLCALIRYFSSPQTASAAWDSACSFTSSSARTISGCMTTSSSMGGITVRMRSYTARVAGDSLSSSRSHRACAPANSSMASTFWLLSRIISAFRAAVVPMLT